MIEPVTAWRLHTKAYTPPRLAHPPVLTFDPIPVYLLCAESILIINTLYLPSPVIYHFFILVKSL